MRVNVPVQRFSRFSQAVRFSDHLVCGAHVELDGLHFFKAQSALLHHPFLQNGGSDARPPGVFQHPVVNRVSSLPEQGILGVNPLLTLGVICLH